MNTGTDSLPNIIRSGVGIVAVSQWESTCTVDQLSMADDLMDTWTLTPADGLLTFSCFAGASDVKDFGNRPAKKNNHENGRGAVLRFMTYEQWATEEALRASLETWRPSSSSVDALVAITDGQPPVSDEYRLYRSHRSSVSEEATVSPRNIVINTVEFDGPNEQRLRRWIDGVIDALEAEPNDIPGLIRAHLHVSASGRRVLNFAEWTSERAYDEALANGPRGVGQTDLTEWRNIKEFPGVKGDTVNQYALHRSLRTPTAGSDES